MTERNLRLIAFTGHRQKAALFFLGGLFIIVLGLGKHDSIAAKPIVVSEPIVEVKPEKKKKLQQIFEEIAQTSQPMSAAVLNHNSKRPSQEAKQGSKITTLEPPSKLANFSSQLEKTQPQEKNQLIFIHHRERLSNRLTLLQIWPTGIRPDYWHLLP